jgi:hypothetical protein
VPITIPGDAGTPVRSNSSLDFDKALEAGWLFLLVLLRDMVVGFLTGNG